MNVLVVGLELGLVDDVESFFVGRIVLNRANITTKTNNIVHPAIIPMGFRFCRKV